MSATKLPAFQFYPGDWMKDPALRGCSIAARGLWMDMLCLMFENVRRGYLQHPTGKPVTAEQLARMTGCSTDELSRLLQELEDSGVFSRTEHGVIFSRRIVRDERKRTLCAEAGKRGGNPTLKGVSKGESKGDAKGGVKPNPTPSSSTSSSSSEYIGGFFGEFWQAYPSSRRIDKAKCQATWKRKNLDDCGREIIAHVNESKNSKSWMDGYVPNSTTYLNQNRWETPVTVDVKPAPAASRKATVCEF